MIKEDEVYKIGRIGKPHGISGEVTLRFSDDVFDRVDADYLVLMVDGILVPFFIEEYRFRSDEVALVKFEDIDTKDRASELTGCDVFFPRHLADAGDDVLTWSQIVTILWMCCPTRLLVALRRLTKQPSTHCSNYPTAHSFLLPTNLLKTSITKNEN